MLLTPLALSATLQFDCPATIETRQQLLGTTQGWQAVIRNELGEQHQPLRHRLENLALFDGDPDERAQLKPDNGDSHAIHYWSLDRHNPRPFYLVCHYRETAITLQQALPAGLGYCRVNQPAPYDLRGLICRSE
ncbi:STY0301 family protein [Aeromonas dhakensis]|uniref:STY0301 family protein n=1 Tax=Aeromonas dhakensis TaxID=196024 RepID=UPI0005A93724|nr:STY0301 family protein [Aeromonas dhakensis]